MNLYMLKLMAPIMQELTSQVKECFNLTEIFLVISTFQMPATK